MWRGVVAGALALVTACIAVAQEPPEDLHTRLEKLEQQNATLLKMLEKLDKDQEAGKEKPKQDGEEPKKEDDNKTKSDEHVFKVTWKDQLFFQTSDKAFRLHVGGRFHCDMAWFTADKQVENGPGGVGPLIDGANFRRARVRFDGTIWDNIDFVSEYDFTNQRDDRGNFIGVGIFDNYIQVSQLPVVGHYRVGHFREPFSYEALASGNDLMFLERSLLQDAFVPFRNIGMMLWDSVLDDRVTWSAGWFFADTNNINATHAAEGDYAGTFRLTCCPYYDCDGCQAFHLGAAFSRRKTSLDPLGGPDFVSFFARPECRVNTPRFADTRRIIAPHYEVLGAEAALIWGRFQLQSEYMCALVSDAVYPYENGQPRGDAFFQGVYVQGSCFLTGECRPYLLKEARPGRLKPHENFFTIGNEETAWACPEYCGPGAWEVALRYSHLDLDNSGIDGGVLNDITAGLNWYLNPNTKVQWNYILVFRDSPNNLSSGTAQIFAMRFAIDF